jgi:hypothetical protein
MSKWPELNDRKWPDDVPDDYLDTPDWGRRPLRASAVSAMFIGMARRIDELERKVAQLEQAA